MRAILAGAFSAPFHTLNFTPELQGELSNILKLRGHRVVQCVSYDFRIHREKITAGHPLRLFACFLCRHVN
jgi:hypothetical protein